MEMGLFYGFTALLHGSGRLQLVGLIKLHNGWKSFRKVVKS
jgi:hypothetical protein